MWRGVLCESVRGGAPAVGRVSPSTRLGSSPGPLERGTRGYCLERNHSSEGPGVYKGGGGVWRQVRGWCVVCGGKWGGGVWCVERTWKVIAELKIRCQIYYLTVTLHCIQVCTWYVLSPLWCTSSSITQNQTHSLQAHSLGQKRTYYTTGPSPLTRPESNTFTLQAHSLGQKQT